MSARTSRVPHPPGSLYLQTHFWVVRAIGKNAAFVLAAIEFLDRAQPVPFQPVVTRERLIADLQHLISKNTLDAALADLVNLGWIRKIERFHGGETNLRHWHEYVLDGDAIAAYLAAAETEFSEVPNLGSQKSQNWDQNWDASTNKKKQKASLAAAREQSDPSSRKKLLLLKKIRNPIFGEHGLNRSSKTKRTRSAGTRL